MNKTEILNIYRFAKQNGFNNEHLEVKQTENKGLGVFAKKEIKQNEIIEICHCITLDWRTKYTKDPQIYRYAVAIYGCDCIECKNHGQQLLIALGYGSIYNCYEFEEQNNAKYLIGVDDERHYIAFYATRNILNGEEIMAYLGDKYYRHWCKIKT